MNELEVAAQLYNAKIIFVTETHLSSDISNAEIKLNNFNVFRQDRKNGKSCGGSCIFVHHTIEAEYINGFVAPDSVGISVKLNSQYFKMLCIYRSQNLSVVERSELLNSIKMLQTKQTEEIHIYGDFNLPNVKWDVGVVNCPPNTINSFFTIQREFLDCLSEKGVTALIKDGTVTRRKMVDGVLQESLLDQVLLSNPATVENVAMLSLIVIPHLQT